MSNLEELIKIRNESIKQQEQYLEMIENAIKEYSITYYQEYINKILSIDAEIQPLSDLSIEFTDENRVTCQIYNHGKEFFNWAKKVTDNNINLGILEEYVKLKYDEPNFIIAEQAIDNNEERKEFLFIRPSYIKELAQKDNLSFEIYELHNDDVNIRVYTVSAMIPKLELDKHKVLMKKN